MAGNEGMVLIDRSSPVYLEVARLHQIALSLRPGGIDRWNGDLYARSDDKWGGLGRDGTMRLNQDLVLRHLTGGELSDDPAIQGQALSTVLHESTHARSEFDAKYEPNALRLQQSVGLDEGLTETATTDDFETFAQLAGYPDVPKPPVPEYAGAVHATNELLDRASTGEADRRELITTALNSPVMMRWDVLADRIVQNELGDVVPQDPSHQQAARAHLINNMAVPEWHGVQDRPKAGEMVTRLTTESLDRAVAEVREHYQNTPGGAVPRQGPEPGGGCGSGDRPAG
ncbi:hypothetical protein EV644_111142 [Kribbella orskensis]|uniref:Large polyvalent protein associated domain-containing protein n=1 Tax=Kribbella orskensis TaxID=2512216 RepID=A0ABY2BG04_9ACTN|nr:MULTISPECIES: hypothetical protein [Kribbella]TCN37594.1 hypothetical protein EV642_111123 [Kribbella sp. VKM Ac-2500]TCO18904.1 hypothetical protein EV644_111142 [Kribbella orskensis]